MKVVSRNSAFLIQPASLSDLSRISELQQKLYPIDDAVPLGKLKEWFQANPKGFFIFENVRGEIVGHITFLPLRPECLERYRTEGDEGIIEKEISGADLHGTEEIPSISDLYLESIILPIENRPLARQALTEALPKIISGIRKSTEEGNVFALAATPAGERWLAKRGFVKISHAAVRRDRHDMYRASMPDFLNQAAKAYSKSEP